MVDSVRLAESDTFIEVNDTLDYANIVSTDSDSTTDDLESWTLDFKITFNFNFPTEELVNCKVHSVGSTGLKSTDIYPNIFKIENDFEFIKSI